MRGGQRCPGLFSRGIAKQTNGPFDQNYLVCELVGNKRAASLGRERSCPLIGLARPEELRSRRRRRLPSSLMLSGLQTRTGGRRLATVDISRSYARRLAAIAVSMAPGQSAHRPVGRKRRANSTRSNRSNHCAGFGETSFLRRQNLVQTTQRCAGTNRADYCEVFGSASPAPRRSPSASAGCC